MGALLGAEKRLPMGESLFMSASSSILGSLGNLLDGDGQ
jgi:hypothetical protein